MNVQGGRRLIKYKPSTMVMLKLYGHKLQSSKVQILEKISIIKVGPGCGKWGRFGNKPWSSGTINFKLMKGNTLKLDSSQACIDRH